MSCKILNKIFYQTVLEQIIFKVFNIMQENLKTLRSLL